MGGPRRAAGQRAAPTSTAAVALWRRARKARGGTKRYDSSKAKTRRAAQLRLVHLRWGGIIILLFVVYHLLHLTWNVVAPGGASDSPYERLVNGFQIWWVVLAYTVAMVAVGFHLRHGTWSALTTLGANTSVAPGAGSTCSPTRWPASITVGFLLPPSRSSSDW